MNAALLTADMTGADSTDAAFERAYREHRAAVFQWSLRYGGGRRAWAEDLTQDVFVRLHRQLDALDAREQLGAWLYRATVNAALNRLRDERSIVGKLAQLLRGERDETPTPEARLSRRQAVLKVLDALPPLERIVMVMKVLDGKSQQEIAQTLALSEGYVSKLSARGWAVVESSTWEADHAP